MKTILITGGAGSVGREVAAALVQLGYHVVVYDLPQCDFGSLEGLSGLEVVRGTIEDAGLLGRLARGVDAVIHLAALLPPASERDRHLTMAVNVHGTQNLVQALRAQQPGAHLIFSSSVCVYGDTSAQDPPVTVSWPARPLDLYGESKAEAERIVRASGLPYTVLRISGVSVPALLEPPAVWPFMASQRIEFICRSDVVAALVNCVQQEAAVGKVLNVAGGSTWRMEGREYVARMNDILGLSPEDASYLDHPGYFDWYDTDASQSLLGYQNTSFAHFVGLLERAIDEALGGLG